MAAFNRKAARQRLHQRIRKKVSGTADRPRLAIYFSGKHVYAQVIDDVNGRTLVAASSLSPELKDKLQTGGNRAVSFAGYQTQIAQIDAD